MGARISGPSKVFGRTLLLAVSLLCAPQGTPSFAAAADKMGVHEGVGSCSGSTCHGRLLSNGEVVRQNELFTWQDRSSAAGSHSRAWRVLSEPLARAIASRLGLKSAQDAPDCLGCHADPVAPQQRGTTFQISDGVGCESCHGGSGAWLPRHYTLDASHAGNVALGLAPLDNPKARASVCLDCHYGSTQQGQFVNHRMMAAGHPRIFFELDLFSALQRHYDVDADYGERKAVAKGMKVWSVGQAMALERTLTVYSDPTRGQAGGFPEFYFFDCQSCHRTISDDPNAKPTAEANPGRQIPAGVPVFNDENMIMLSAAARLAAPNLAERFEANSRAFHSALARDRASAIAAAADLKGSARALADAFAAREFSGADTFAVLENILSTAISARYTDYTGSAQAVMATDTLLNALIADSQVDRNRAEAIRTDINRLYSAVRDPNAYRPAEFRQAIQRVAAAVRRLR